MGYSFKNKKVITITNAFQNISDYSNRKASKILIDKIIFAK